MMGLMDIVTAVAAIVAVDASRSRRYRQWQVKAFGQFPSVFFSISFLHLLFCCFDNHCSMAINLTTNEIEKTNGN